MTVCRRRLSSWLSRSEEHTSKLQSRLHLVCRLLLEKKKGAVRSRLIRHLLTESVLLALPAAAAGFALSQVTIQDGERLMFATMPAEFAEFSTVIPLPPDARVFGFMLAAAVVSAVLFGLAPAIQATRPNVMQAARGDFSSDFRPAPLRNALVAGQITMCALLLICAGV